MFKNILNNLFPSFNNNIQDLCTTSNNYVQHTTHAHTQNHNRATFFGGGGGVLQVPINLIKHEEEMH